MDLRDCAVIDRHYPRLQQCLEPSKLLNYLENVGVLDEDDVEAIREEKRKTCRENQVATFIDIMKRREQGFRHLLQALLKSKVQDFLARELLEDDVYDEEGMSNGCVKVVQITVPPFYLPIKMLPLLHRWLDTNGRLRKLGV